MLPSQTPRLRTLVLFALVAASLFALPIWAQFSHAPANNSFEKVTVTESLTVSTGVTPVIGSTTFTEAELGVLDAVTAGTVAASKAVVVDSGKDVGSFGSLTAGQYRVTNGSALSAANPTLAKATLQAASFYAVDTSSNAVDVDIGEDAAMDSADVGTRKTFAVTTGHATQALTVTAGASGITTVTTLDTLGTTCEDTGDFIECLVTTTSTATCVTYCAD